MMTEFALTTKFKTRSRHSKSKGYDIMSMLWQLSLHQRMKRVSVTKLKVGYRHVDDDSFSIRKSLPVNQIG